MKNICIYICLLFFALEQPLSSKTNYLYHPAPIADFHFDSFCLGDTTYFINTTQGGVYFTWNIFTVDSNNVNIDTIYTSSDYNAIFVFPTSGTYKVELIADNGHIVSIEKIIYVNSSTTANFDYQQCGGQFNNLSVCYTSSYWDFGDGQTSVDGSPQHFYNTIGVYTVTLIAKNNSESDTLKTPLNVLIANSLDGTFSMKVFRDSVLYYINDTLAYVPSDSILVYFQTNDSVSGTMTQYHWSFGDETVADLFGYNGGRKVYHRYANRDTIYTVFLLVRTLCLTAFSTQNLTFYDHPIGNQNSETIIYPNPATEDQLHVSTNKFDELTDVIVLNYLSQPVVDYNVSKSTTGFDLDITNLSAGLYFIRIVFGNEIITKKIIRE
ncbi:MAG: T9SS type A sorting domain-containing protein [Bacteroidetes bacterium]|nr:T9SS type A sorting domain-containing protein [Bacteroidota bacterium]